MTLLEKVRSGKAKVVVSMFRGPQELSYESLDFDAAAARLRESQRLVNGHSYGLPAWQWTRDDGDDPTAAEEAEIAELERALYAASRGE